MVDWLYGMGVVMYGIGVFIIILIILIARLRRPVSSVELSEDRILAGFNWIFDDSS